jgi:hypothetical protein
MSFTDRFVDIATRPVPLRTLALRKFLTRWPIGSYSARLRASAVSRPAYGWCMYYAAEEARRLGHKAMTVIELGVAGGDGLLSLCQHRRDIQKQFGLEIVVVGFDTGTGLPVSDDTRDLLYCWPAGSFEMDRNALEKRLDGQAQLVLGDLASTAAQWSAEPEAPLGAVMFDLDFYSSTIAAFSLLTKQNVLPRIWCYFDDIAGGPDNAYTDYIGVREAIREFNLDPERRAVNDHLSPAYTFRGLRPEDWHDQIYLYHRLGHPDYNTCLSTGEKHQLGLTGA